MSTEAKCKLNALPQLHCVSKKLDTPIMSHNSSKNQTLSIIFDLINCPSMLDTLP